MQVRILLDPPTYLDGVMVAYESPKLLVAVRVRIGIPVYFLACRSAVDQVTVNHSVVGSIPTTPAILGGEGWNGGGGPLQGLRESSILSSSTKICPKPLQQCTLRLSCRAIVSG
jgi:hypothetical protein